MIEAADIIGRILIFGFPIICICGIPLYYNIINEYFKDER